jgi:hypothetical protein
MLKQASRVFCLVLPLSLILLLSAAAHSAMAQNASAPHTANSPDAFNSRTPVRSADMDFENKKTPRPNDSARDSTLLFLMGDVLIEKGSLKDYLHDKKSIR